MPYNIKQVGENFAVVVTNTGKVVGTHPSKKKAQAQLAALYANVKDVKKESAGAERLSGGPGFKIEFNVPDCQGGYAVMKAGSGQVIGCYTTKEHAQEAMDAIAVNEPDLTKTANPTPTPDSTSIWDGVFVPLGEAMSGTNYGSIYGDTGWKSTYNTPPQNDGKPNVGYGNRSDKHGRSNS